MRKIFKSGIAFLLALVICISMLVPAFAADNTKTITNVNETYALVHACNFIEIYQGTLYQGKKTTDVYYVVCRGLDFTGIELDNPRGYANCIKIGLSVENNAYVKAIRNALNEKVPANSYVVFVGHSLGGMVIQQAIAQKDIKDKYNILYTLSIGSPYIITKNQKEGTLRRMVDRLDPIPYLSIAFLTNPLIGNVALETSFQAPLVHFASYEKGTCWNKYDCLGVKNGGAKIVIDLDSIYKAPFDFNK